MVSRTVIRSVAAGLLAATGLLADIASIEYSVVYSGDSKPIGEPPWLSARFEDVKGDLGESVLVTLDVTGLVDKEFVSSFFFNFRESIDPGSVRISGVVGNNFKGEPEFRLGRQDDQNAGGGFRFDLEVDLPTSRRERMGEGSQLSFLLQREGGIGIYDLLVTTLSEGKDESLSVAHIQSLSDGGSVWVTAGSRFSQEDPGAAAVPEPATTGAMAVVGGLLLWSGARRRRHAQGG
jgi:hypothetical protein